MLGLLYRLIIGNFYSCNHQYEIIDKYTNTNDRTPIGVGYILQCKKCEIVKRKNLNHD